METTDRFNRAIAEFDLLNAQDPNHRTIDGEAVPFELFFSNRMTDWVFRLKPNASEAVRLAARCQHLCRWEIPRTDYPDGRIGYLTWREDLKTFHADRSAEVLKQAGYDSVTIERVRSINMKRQPGSDPEVQLIEDALCLVFLENQYDDLISKTAEGKMISILQKTWKKMSEQAHEAALGLEFSERGLKLVKKALRG